MIALEAETGRIPLHRLPVAAALGLTALLLLGGLASLVEAAGTILPYPYGFDYGEGIVWQQMRDILRGEAYGPLGVFPAIVYHYPPVFHLVAGALAHGAGLDELLAGRLVSLLATFASALLVGGLTCAAMPEDAPPVRFGCALLSALACFAWEPVMAWAPLMRVDMLACAFSLAGLALTIRALDRPLAIHAASLAFVLAVYTKQVSVAAPAAAFLALLILRKDLALRLAIGCIALGSAILAVLCLLTDGGFLRHIVLYNVNRLDLARSSALVALLGAHGLLIAPAILGVAELAGRLGRRPGPAKGREREILTALLLLAYLGLKTLMLPMIMKSGAAQNYFIEWCFALTACLGIGLRPALLLVFAPPGRDAPRLAPLLFGLVLLGLPVQAVTATHWGVTDSMMSAKARALDPVVAMIAAADRPVISDEMTLPIRAGRAVLWEPAIAAELAHSGRYDEPAFAAMVRAGAFGFVVTEGRPGQGAFDERYNPPVAEALEAGYPVTREIGGLVLHLPR